MWQLKFVGHSIYSMNVSKAISPLHASGFTDPGMFSILVVLLAIHKHPPYDALEGLLGLEGSLGKKGTKSAQSKAPGPAREETGHCACRLALTQLRRIGPCSRACPHPNGGCCILHCCAGLAELSSLRCLAAIPTGTLEGMCAYVISKRLLKVLIICRATTCGVNHEHLC